jgi:mannose-6-phosphate isomerase-like protein (cupin superfamily)
MEVWRHSDDIDRLIFDGDVIPRGKIMQIAMSQFQPHQSCSPHKHYDLHEVFVCESGEIDLTVDSEEIHVVPGDVVLVRPGHVHSLINRSEILCEMLLIGIACPLQ